MDAWELELTVERVLPLGLLLFQFLPLPAGFGVGPLVRLLLAASRSARLNAPIPARACFSWNA